MRWSLREWILAVLGLSACVGAYFWKGRCEVQAAEIEVLRRQIEEIHSTYQHQIQNFAKGLAEDQSKIGAGTYLTAGMAQLNPAPKYGYPVLNLGCVIVTI